MGRPKGSKNKPKFTLEVTPQITSEISSETTSDMSSKEDSAKNAQVNDLSDSEPTKKKRHRRTKAEMEAYRASLKAQSTIPGEFDPEQLLKDVNFISEQKQDEINLKFKETINILESRNVPTLSDRVTAYQESKPEIEEEKLINNQENSEEPENPEKQVKESKSKKTKQIKSTYPLCDCCQQEIYCQPHRIDTNILSAQVADYHRVSPRWVNLCSACAKKLSDVVDNWLQENSCITRMEQRTLEKQKEKDNG